MPEWLVEQGIGEDRAILLDRGRIVAARVCWGEPIRAGLVAEARLASKPAGARRGTAILASTAVEVLVDGLPGSVREGETIRVRIVRPALAEQGRTKRAQGRYAGADPLAPPPSLSEQLASEDIAVRTVRIGETDFAEAGWDDLVGEALTGEVAFAGGTLTVSATPAMTLIDIDGGGTVAALALAAAPAVAEALGRLDIGGSVGIDFPSLAEKRDRQAVDAALAAALAGWQGERTAMNGFGFVQLVSRLQRPSLVARYARRSAAGARILLRSAERVVEPGAIELVAHPAVRRAVTSEWETELARRTGRSLRWREEPKLALTAGFAQAVTS